jgi:hypothetical protein
MNRIHYCHRVRRTAAILGAFAASVLVLLTGATAAFAYPIPPGGGPAGPVQPPRVQTIVTGGMPGWQIALIAIGAAIFAAALAVTLDRSAPRLGRSLPPMPDQVTVQHPGRMTDRRSCGLERTLPHVARMQ